MEPSQLIEATIRALWDVLTFRTFISPPMLIVIYYLGAVGIPLLVWSVARPVKARITDINLPEVELPNTSASHWLPHSTKVVVYSLAAFLLMELLWRLMFEFLLAYFQMHDYLAAMQNG